MSEERPYAKLNQEERKRVANAFRAIAEAGDLSPKLHPSLIGIAADEYDVDWPDPDVPAEGINRRLPPELTSYSYNCIDAYATALLATETFLAPGCRLTASCEFSPADNDGITLRLSCNTSFLSPELFGDRLAAFLSGFVSALGSKGVSQPGMIFCDYLRAPAWFRSPGQMLLSKSNLADLPPEKWPVASRTLMVTDETRASARNAILLLRTTDMPEQ